MTFQTSLKTWLFSQGLGWVLSPSAVFIILYFSQTCAALFSNDCLYFNCKLLRVIYNQVASKSNQISQSTKEINQNI